VSSMLALLQHVLEYGASQGQSFVGIAEFVTLSSLIASFLLFLSLAIRSRHAEGGIARSFKFQLSIAILFWILGEVISFFNYADLGMYVHTCSMALFAFFLAYRVRALASR
jgi:hypothetical protein